ncbi:MAG: hypothetical protein JKY37_05695 [Nannocystaceae bacterium]|nr:hypothetical protein [Nannocystaceae bacterium]
MRHERAALLAAFAITLACGQTEFTPAAPPESTQVSSSRVCVPNPGKVDVLLVIDDSASMGEEAETLARNLAAFMGVYERIGGALDYRIAVTTTSVAGSQCPGSPDGGGLIATACTQRVDDFVVAASHESLALDVRHTCNDHCSLPDLPITPTAVAGDDRPPSPRPWLQREVGQHNFPDDVDAGAMLACMGQVGAAGCVYESPLEAARRALLRMQDSQDPAFGFMRDDAALFVMFIGDEGDCSVREAHADLFEADGDTALWESDEPTSAICWRAGMLCEGGPGKFDDCHAANVGRDGDPSTAVDAVLRPVDDYLDLLETIDINKRRLGGLDTQRVFISAVAGGKISDDAVFQDSLDPAFQAAFGIGPGCMTGTATGLPPGRVAEVVRAFEEYNGMSATTCSADWTQALACVPNAWPPPTRIPCAEFCVADADPSTTVLEPDCVVTETRGGQTHSIPACTRNEQDEWDYPDGADTCARWFLGEDRPEACIEAEFNVGWTVQRQQRIWEGGCIEVTCTVSATPDIDCP